MIGWLRELWRRVSGRAAAEAMVQDFIATFPGQCMICSNHRFGRRQGYVKPDAIVKAHYCIEREAVYGEGNQQGDG